MLLDHPFHNVEILGGMWGAHNSLDRKLSQKILNLMLKKPVWKTYNPTGQTPKGYDQYFLRDYVYPLIRNISTIHDSYTCAQFRDSQPFPTQRRVKDHIGSVHIPGMIPQFDIKCPNECRPEKHKNWTLC